MVLQYNQTLSYSNRTEYKQKIRKQLIISVLRIFKVVPPVPFLLKIVTYNNFLNH